MNSEGICRACLAESISTVDLFSEFELPIMEENDETLAGTTKIRLDAIYSELTQLPLEKDQQQEYNPVRLPQRICTSCVEMLKEFYIFRQKAKKAYEELHTKASIAHIISQLDAQSSMGSVRDDRLEEDFADDLIAAADSKLGDSRFKKPLAEGELRCEICQRVFKNRQMLMRHQEIHSSENRYKCRYCGRWFRARASWYNHELKHRNAVGREERLDYEFLCEICAKGFKTKRQLSDHLEIVHNGIKRYPCDICNKSFTRNGSLAEHKLIQHAGIKQFSCGTCGKSFGKVDSLRTHQMIHQGKRFRCEHCPKAFLKNAFLKAHITKAHPPNEEGRTVERVPKRNSCQVCGKNFNTSNHLKNHLLIHSNEKPEVCQICGNAFRQKQQLKVHMYQHLGKPFKCQFCTATFGIRSRLKAHVAKNHSEQTASLPEELSGVLPPTGSLPVDSIINEPDFGDGAINEEILNEICCQIDASQIVLQNIVADDGVNLIYSTGNEQIAFFDDTQHLETQYYDFSKQTYPDTSSSTSGVLPTVGEIPK